MRPLLLLASLAMTACADARDCFAPDTALPRRDAVLAAAGAGTPAHRLLVAVYDGDLDTATTTIRTHPDLGRAPAGAPFTDPLSIAIATCRKPMVERLLAAGVPADPPGAEPPLLLALRANDPWFATALLKAGASANAGSGRDDRPLDAAILLGSLEKLRLLLDHGARLDHRDSLGATPLQTAIDAHRFAAAELMLARGADPWAADRSGGTLGWAVSRPALATDADDKAAHQRLAARLDDFGWPRPAPSPREVRDLAASGRWPPPHARH
ncbi:MAG: hypothetical protein DCF31_09500 [Alphaproteobacteria bacterium]|nr:MAG: hypothetical protein DCF31_09500 [Alphaproteobacteria bacterium]